MPNTTHWKIRLHGKNMAVSISGKLNCLTGTAFSQENQQAIKKKT